jgi:hypothetical protein
LVSRSVNIGGDVEDGIDDSLGGNASNLSSVTTGHA